MNYLNKFKAGAIFGIVMISVFVTVFLIVASIIFLKLFAFFAIPIIFGFEYVLVEKLLVYAEDLDRY